MDLGGPGGFENARALEWLGELEAAHDLQVLTRALRPDPEGAFLDRDTGSEILAAGEVVAAAVGRPAGDLPARALAWIEKHRGLDFAALKPPARALVQALLSPRSELHDLWEERAQGYDAWADRVEDLVARLG